MSTLIPEAVPAGIAAAGRGSLFATVAVANPQAPKLSEFTGSNGFAIHCDLTTWAPTLDQPKIQKNRYCLEQAQERFGRKQWSIDPLTVVYNPQEPDSEDYQAYLKLVEGSTFWVADRRGKPSRAPLVVGDVADLLRIEIGGRDRVGIGDEDGQDLETRIFVAVQEVVQDAVFVA